MTNTLLLACQPGASTPPTPSLRWGTRANENDWAAVNALKSGLLVRRQLPWASVQGTKGGAYNWSGPDAWIPAATAAGVPLMVVLERAPAWATAGKGAGNYYPANNQDDFYDFCAAAAARYPQVKYWEIMNEPNFRGWTPQQVGEILDGAARAMVSARSTAKVIGIVRAGALGSGAQAWTGTILDIIKGAPVYGVSYHDYSRPDPPETAKNHGPLITQIENSIAVLDAHEFRGKLFITEFGFPTTYAGARDSGYTSEADAARWTVRQSIIHGSYDRIEASVQFKLWGGSTTIEEGGMGLIRGPNDRGGPGETSAGPAGSFKPGYYSYQNMMRILDETTVSITAISVGPLWKYRFDKLSGAYGYIVWCLSGTVATTLTDLTPTVKVTQNDGTSAVMVTTDGTLTLSATVDPQYIEPI